MAQLSCPLLVQTALRQGALVHTAGGRISSLLFAWRMVTSHLSWMSTVVISPVPKQTWCGAWFWSFMDRGRSVIRWSAGWSEGPGFEPWLRRLQRVGYWASSLNILSLCLAHCAWGQYVFLLQNTVGRLDKIMTAKRLAQCQVHGRYSKTGRHCICLATSQVHKSQADCMF